MVAKIFWMKAAAASVITCHYGTREKSIHKHGQACVLCGSLLQESRAFRRAQGLDPVHPSPRSHQWWKFCKSPEVTGELHYSSQCNFFCITEVFLATTLAHCLLFTPQGTQEHFIPFRTYLCVLETVSPCVSVKQHHVPSPAPLVVFCRAQLMVTLSTWAHVPKWMQRSGQNLELLRWFADCLLV